MKNQMTITEIRRHFEQRRRREVKRDTFTLNGNTYTVNNDPKHQRSQLAGYFGNNPKQCLTFDEKFETIKSVMRDIEKRKELKKQWEAIHPIDRPDWELFKRGIWKSRKLHHIWPMADMADRERRAKEWTEHLAKKAEREKKMFEAAEAVGTVIDDEIWDFGPEC